MKPPLGLRTSSGIMLCADRTVHLYESLSVAYQGHVKQVLGLDFNPNGYQIATGSADHTGEYGLVGCVWLRVSERPDIL